MDRFRGEAPLRPALRIWLWWLVVSSGIDAWAFGWQTSLVQSGAYEWANGLVGPKHWAVFMLFTAVMAFTAEQLRNTTIARIALVCSALYHLVFGASIWYLTLEGTVSAITGATKWWAYTLVSIIFFWLPTLYDTEGRLRDALDSLDVMRGERDDARDERDALRGFSS